MSIAEKMAANQKQVAISEFFEKNKHFLGFDTLNRALITAVKEAVDNALDACEEARILPDIVVKITKLDNNPQEHLRDCANLQNTSPWSSWQGERNESCRFLRVFNDFKRFSMIL